MDRRSDAAREFFRQPHAADRRNRATDGIRLAKSQSLHHD
jgi:hypothetical protein